VKTWAAVIPTHGSTDPPGLPGARRLKSRWTRGSRALLIAAGMLPTSAASCDDDPAATPIPAFDAGVPCPQGTQGCACFFGSGCDDGLLCITGRCLMGQGEETEPVRPQRPQILPGRPDSDPPGVAPGNPRDAGGSPLDAGEPPDAADGG
jgi:hypothetical protein